jgi:hypothetical protein
MNKENKLNAQITIIFKEMKNLEIELTSDQLSNKNDIKMLNNNNNNVIIELNIKSITSSFFSLKTRNIFDNFSYSFEIKYGGTPFNFKLVNMLGEKVFEAEGMGNTMSAKADANRACKRALGKMEKLPYKYDPSQTPKLPTPTTEKSLWTEDRIKEYLLSADIDVIEGIYKNMGGSFFKLAILKDNGKFLAIVMDTDRSNWFVGSVKVVFEELKSNFYNTSYYDDNYSRMETISEIDENGVLKIGDYSYMKIFPILK